MRALPQTQRWALLLLATLSHVWAAEKAPIAIALPAGAAKITGANARLEGTGEKRISWWTHPDTFLEWIGEVPAPGRYRVEMEYSLPAMNNGSELSVAIGPHKLKAFPKASARTDELQKGRLGEVTFDQAGKINATIRSAPKAPQYVINIRSLCLIPAEMPTEAIDISGRAIEAGEDKSFTLSASEAQIKGMNAVLVDGGSGVRQIGFWKDIGTSLSWTIHFPVAGKYRVEMQYSQNPADAGARIAIAVGQQKVIAKPVPGKDAADIVTGQAGEIMIAEEGTLRVTAKPVSKPGPSLVSLVAIALRPAAVPTEATNIADQPTAQAEDGSLQLVPADAEIDGEAIRLEGAEKKHLAWWNQRDRAIKWSVKFTKPGIYEVSAVYARMDSPLTDQVQFSVVDEDVATLPSALGGKSRITLTMSGQTVVHDLKAGSSWEDFKTEKLGKITVAEAGETEAVFTATERLGVPVAHLQSISFHPVEE